MTIIDSAVRFSNAPTAVEAWLARAVAVGITHSVIAPSDAEVTVLNDQGNRRMIELVKRYPAAISGLAVASPWHGRAAVDLLRRGLDEGLVGFYLHPMRQGFRLSESVIEPLIAQCAERNKPVYCATGTPACSTPFQLAELARRFPSVVFVMGHTAYADFWYDVLPAMEQTPNLLAETSCQVGGVLGGVIASLDAGRVVFGSGYPRSDPAVELSKLRRMAARLADRGPRESRVVPRGRLNPSDAVATGQRRNHRGLRRWHNRADRAAQPDHLVADRRRLRLSGQRLLHPRVPSTAH